MWSHPTILTFISNLTFMNHAGHTSLLQGLQTTHSIHAFFSERGSTQFTPSMNRIFSYVHKPQEVSKKRLQMSEWIHTAHSFQLRSKCSFLSVLHSFTDTETGLHSSYLPLYGH